MAEASEASEAIVRWLVEMNAWTGLVLLAVVAADLLLAPRVGASWRSLLYGAVLLRLCVPLDLTTPLALGIPREAWGATVTSLPGTVASSPPAAAAPADGPVPGRALRAWPLLGSLHAAGAGLLLLLWARARRRLSRVARESSPAGHMRAGSRRVPILAHPAWGPGLIGFRYPRLVVPESLVAAGREPMAWVERHEAAHLRRGDHLTLPLLQLLVMLLWPVLPLWLALIRYRRLVEMACDERALEGATPRRRREYGELLLSFASRPATPAAFIESLQEVSMSRDVIGRIAELRHRRRLAPGLQAIVVVPLALLVAIVTGPRAMGDPAGEPATAPAGKQAMAQSDCQREAMAVASELRHVRVLSMEEREGTLLMKVEIEGPDPRSASTMLVRGLDARGLEANRVMGGPSSDASPILPLELELSCPAADGGRAQAGPPLGIACPGEPATAEGALRDALAARAASSPRIEAKVTREPAGLHVTGSAATVDAVQTLAGELEACATFSGVELRSVRARKDGACDFDLVALLPSGR